MSIHTHLTKTEPPINSLIMELLTIKLSFSIGSINLKKESILCASAYSLSSLFISLNKFSAYFLSIDNSYIQLELKKTSALYFFLLPLLLLAIH